MCLLTLVSCAGICSGWGAICRPVCITVLVPVVITTALLESRTATPCCSYKLAELNRFLVVHVAMTCNMLAVSKTKTKGVVPEAHLNPTFELWFGESPDIARVEYIPELLVLFEFAIVFYIWIHDSP